MAGNLVMPDPAAKADDPEAAERMKGISRRYEIQSFKEKYKGRTSAADVAKLLDEFDANRDGSIDKYEFAHIIDNLVSERAKRQQLKHIIIVMTIFGVLLLGALSGMTWAVVANFAKTDVNSKSGTLYVRGSSTIVQTLNSDLSVVDNVLIARQPNPSSSGSTVTANATSSGTTSAVTNGSMEASPTNVLRAASYIGPPQRFTSRLPVRVLMELKYFYIQGPGDTELALVVQGVARVPSASSVWGSVVRIVTAAGTITLDDTAISFQEDIAPIFLEAGFSVSANRRSLLGVYEILGFFNFIADMSVFNLPPSEPKPRLTAENFKMRIKVYEPCVLPINPGVDRCLYTPSSATNAEQAGTGRRRELRTIPHQRALQQAATDASEDLAGTELFEGQRYMTHHETSWTWKGVSRTEYEYAIFPAYRKVELVDPATQMVDVWQERTGIPAEDAAASLVNATYFFCNRLPADDVTGSGFKGANASMSNFTFLGFEEYDGRLARHFRLWVPQPVNQSEADAATPVALEVDYWDSRQNYAPLGFETTHPMAGKIHMKIEVFEELGAADVDPTAFIGRAGSPLCSNDTLIPYLTSPIAVPVYGLSALNVSNATTEGAANRRRRRLTFDTFSDEAAPSPALHEAGADNMMNRRDLVSMTWSDYCGDWSTTKKFEGSKFGCYIGLYLVGPARNRFHAEASCSNVPVPSFPFLSLYGNVLLNSCTQRVGGCIGARFNLANLLDRYRVLSPLKKYIQKIVDLDAWLCAGYNRYTNTGFASGSVVMRLGPASGTISANMNFVECGIVLSSATAEGSIILKVFGRKVEVSTGSVELINNWWLVNSC